jgi:tetratricopeptide (TPR) repeat protein
LQDAAAVHRRATRCKEGCIDEAFLNLGFVLRALERYSEARKCFQRALEIDPKYKEAKEALADIEGVMEPKREG